MSTPKDKESRDRAAIQWLDDEISKKLAQTSKRPSDHDALSPVLPNQGVTPEFETNRGWAKRLVEDDDSNAMHLATEGIDTNFTRIGDTNVRNDFVDRLKSLEEKGVLKLDDALKKENVMRAAHLHGAHKKADAAPANQRYRILRLYQNTGHNRITRRNLSLAEAREHCKNPETSSTTCKHNPEPQNGPWFDSYEADAPMSERLQQNVGQLWSDHELTRVGEILWSRTYKLGADDGGLRIAAHDMALAFAEDALQRGALMDEGRVMVFEAVASFGAKWAVHAFQRIMTTHTFGAALMCSDADRSALEDIEMQWQAFMVVLPNGLLSYFDEDQGVQAEYNRILVASFDDQATLVLVNQGAGRASQRLVVNMASSIASLLDIDRNLDMQSSVGADPPTEVNQARLRRVMIMAKRLVAGLLLSLQHQDNFKSKTVPARTGRPGRDEAEPAHRVVMVGRPLNIDCRPAAKDFIANGSPKRKGAPPAVQYVVRGHFKRQVIGVARSGRKVIWVQPYWKGPIEAPILTRPKMVGQPKKGKK